MKSERDGRVLVSAWIPKDLVKRMDHLRIDLEIPTRQEMLERIVREWMSAPAPTKADR